MKPSSVMRSRVNVASRCGLPSRPSTSPSGAAMIRCSVYVPGAGSTKSRAGSAAGSCAATDPVAASQAASSNAACRVAILKRLAASLRRCRAQRVAAELHVVRTPELFLREVHLERLRQLLAVPPEAAQELLVVGAALVPVGE